MGIQIMNQYIVSKYSAPIVGVSDCAKSQEFTNLENAMKCATAWADKRQGNFAEIHFIRSILIGRIGQDPTMVRAKQGSTESDVGCAGSDGSTGSAELNDGGELGRSDQDN